MRLLDDDWTKTPSRFRDSAECRKMKFAPCGVRSMFTDFDPANCR
jgi:hypothetical protein